MVYLPKWKAVKVRQELVEEANKEVEKSQYPSLSEFVSEAIRLRLQTLAKERISEYIERDKQSRIFQLQGQLLYTPKHVWVKLTPQGNVKIGITDQFFQAQLKEIVNIHGITDQFQRQLKEIVYITTDKAREKVSKDEPFGMVETWWFAYDLYSPLNGKIVSVNKKVIDDPFILNVDPYQCILEVQPKNTEVDSWMNELLSLGEYKKLL